MSLASICFQELMIAGTHQLSFGHTYQVVLTSTGNLVEGTKYERKSARMVVIWRVLCYYYRLLRQMAAQKKYNYIHKIQKYESIQKYLDLTKTSLWSTCISFERAFQHAAIRLYSLLLSAVWSASGKLFKRSIWAHTLKYFCSQLIFFLSNSQSTLSQMT